MARRCAASVRAVSRHVAVTDRLVLDRVADDDAEDLAGLGTVEVVRFLGGTPWTVSSVRESISIWRDIEERLGITTWVVRTKESGEIVGTCGFAGTNVPWLRFDAVIEIGWTLGRRWWGQGLATEAARAALGVGLTTYQPEQFVSKCHVDNLSSEKVMQRIGMRRVGVVQGGWPEPTIVYRMV